MLEGNRTINGIVIVTPRNKRVMTYYVSVRAGLSPTVNQCDEADGSQEIGCQLVIAGCDAAVVFKPVELVFDFITVAVGMWREVIRPMSVSLGRDVWHRASTLHLATDGVAVIALFASEDENAGHVPQQDTSGSVICDLTTVEQEHDGAAVAIGQGVDLGGAPVSVAADRLFALLHLPPEVQKCTLSAGEAITTAARASRRRQGHERYCDPDALCPSTHKAAMEGFPRTISPRPVGPAATRLYHANNAAEHAALINLGLVPRITWQHRRKPRGLLFDQPQMIANHRWSPFNLRHTRFCHGPDSIRHQTKHIVLNIR